MEVRCPGCSKPTQFVPSNKFRPFCSERCATLDLGAWAEEKYKVPVAVQETESVNENTDDDSTPNGDFSLEDDLH